jgi:hypothetical protein
MEKKKEEGWSEKEREEEKMEKKKEDGEGKREEKVHKIERRWTERGIGE